MIQINISEALKTACPNFTLGCIECDVSIQIEQPELWKRIAQALQELETSLTPESIRLHPNIKNARAGYKKLGKDPSRYRLSSEALLRRVVKGKGIYKINNVVDSLNLVSITSGYSIGGFDAAKIEGSIAVGIGQANEPYQAIGRGQLNIQYLPTFRDTISAFGTPTSDSMRTRVTEKTTRFLMAIVDFDRHIDLEKTMDFSIEVLTEFANGQNFEKRIIS